MGIKKNFYGGPRGFSSSIEHDYAVLALFNETVNQDDEVYILGDLMLEDNEHGLKFIKQLNGKLHIILGNHDSNTRIELYKQLPNVVEVTYATIIKIGKYSFYLCHYPVLIHNYDDNKKMWNLHGHTHSIDKVSEYYHCYNVALDAHKCCPISIDDIIEDIKNYNNQHFSGNVGQQVLK